MAENNSFRNRYPIILVHGIFGWGRDEVLGFKYWGGNVDIEARLNDMHYRTQTATVGPVSSSWERAVELYHYLVGGRVDYGAAHASKYGIQRYGHTFPGIYPQVSHTNKIHLVGHSMGAQTICELESMLRNGSQEERDYHQAHPGDTISELFLGGKNWVHSITGVAPGFNGTTFLDTTNGPVNMMNLFRQNMLCLATANGADPTNFVYDFKLDQWGLKREKGEHFIEYLERIIDSDLWKSRDTALFDISTAGAAKIVRERIRLFPGTHYFSFSGKTTFINPRTGYALPLPATHPALYLGALVMGRNHGNPELPGEPIEWRDSDGCIPCAGTRYIFDHPHRDADPLDMSFPAGIWNAFPVMHDCDHMALVGIGAAYQSERKDIMPFYADMARILTATEQQTDAAHADAATAHGATHPTHRQASTTKASAPHAKHHDAKAPPKRKH
ncbi:esterase/lipase family protein [Dyella telluris]|uniref:triacylglycerol lipase n=1 Tax=Dyella telluris TaxID=2763498 RepID=A0A7G8Q5G1_9GAMM|nr:lipase [Dyella telluris]QNK02019.1 lipase [Dyella telluris]